MTRTSPAGAKRFALSAALAVPLAGIFLCSLAAQPFRPPRPTIPMPPTFRPPTIRPTFPPPPTIRPTFPPPPTIRPTLPPPNFPRTPALETVWKCGRCGAELSRGGAAPATTTCPRCSARIINGVDRGGGGPMAAVPRTPPGGMPPAPLPPGLPPGIIPTAPAPGMEPPPPAMPVEAPRFLPEGNDGASTGIIVGGVLLGLMVLGGIVALAVRSARGY